jgi:hypothetical protein
VRVGAAEVGVVEDAVGDVDMADWERRVVRVSCVSSCCPMSAEKKSSSMIGGRKRLF